MITLLRALAYRLAWRRLDGDAAIVEVDGEPLYDFGPDYDGEDAP